MGGLFNTLNNRLSKALSRDNYCVVQLHCCNLVLAIAMCKIFPQMFSCLRHSDRHEPDVMGHVFIKVNLLAPSSAFFSNNATYVSS